MAEKKKTSEKPASEHKAVSGVEDGKTIAIISYVTLIGWVVALVMNNDKKNTFAKFHIRQSLLLMLVGLVLSFIPIIGWLANIGVLVLWVMALISAINGQEKELPIIGQYAQEWFKGL